LLSVGTDADASAELPSEVRLKPDGAIHERDLVRRFAVGYFQGLPVLAALDANHDLTISAEEISRAAETLGKLSPKERGGGRRLMRLHPVLAALDANGNGEISAREIRNAPAALRKLDKNGDGKLTLDEILPDPVAYWAAVIRRPGMTEAELRKEIRRRADLDRDGAVTWEEILTAVQSGLLDLRK
jgi:Ca2+-binding EF-hand superfamily protein